MKPLGIVTYLDEPGLSPDDQLLAPELARRGWNVTPVAWDDPEIDMAGRGPLIIRSCWNYHLMLPEFLRWLDAVESRGVPILNSPELIRWNSTKTYLRDLERKGIPTPATSWLERGSSLDLKDLLEERRWDEAVLKPVVSAAARATFRVTRGTAQTVQEACEPVLREQGFMFQEFLPEMIDPGEISLTFFSGRYSHSVLKRPKVGDFKVGVFHGGEDAPYEPSDEVVDQARRVVDTIPPPWLFARVDGIVRNSTLLLTELELIEPWLYLAECPQAAGRFADAIESILGDRR